MDSAQLKKVCDTDDEAGKWKKTSLSYLRHLENACKNGSTPSKLADAYRGMYLHLTDLQMEWPCLKPVEQSSSFLSNHYGKEYASVVDRMDELGMNNYAEGALALCNFHKNESAKWTSSLTVDGIMDMCGDGQDSDSECGDDDTVTLRDNRKDVADECVTPGTTEGPTGSKPLFKSGQQTALSPRSSLPCVEPLISVGSGDPQGLSSSLVTNNNAGASSPCSNSAKVPGPLPTPHNPPSNHFHQRLDQNAVYPTTSARPTSESCHPNSMIASENVVFSKHRSGFADQNSNFCGSISNFDNQNSNVMDHHSNLFNSRPNNDRKSSNNFWANSAPSICPTSSLFPQSNVAMNASSPSGPNMNSSSHSYHNARGGLNNRSIFATSHEIQQRERVTVNPEKVGGPYSNFGQKRKNPSSTSSGPRWGSKPSQAWTNQRRDEDSDEEESRQTPFRTAREQHMINQYNKPGAGMDRTSSHGAAYGTGKRSLGTRRGPAAKFVPPILNRESEEDGLMRSGVSNRHGSKPDGSEEPEDERLRGIDPKMIELINNEIMDQSAYITWDDIAGLEFAKKTIKEIVVWPMLRPDIFTGLRGPPKGLLLFGPPGTGKTLIGKCIASQSKSTFFCISASSLTSKWVGEGEKMVRALFAVARVHQPSVVFIDEIDSLLSQRSDSEHESSRRIKTEFLVQLDGAATGSEDRILVIGATNRPQEIDEAARRRFVKRLLIPLPESVARRQIIVNLMSQQKADLSPQDIEQICEKTDGYSGADMTNLCRESALGPIRSIPFEAMETVTADEVRPITLGDFEAALHQVRASVSTKDLQLYTEWNQTYGSFAQ